MVKRRAQYGIGEVCCICLYQEKYHMGNLCTECLNRYRSRVFKDLRAMIETWGGWFAATRYVDFLLRRVKNRKELDACAPKAYYTTVVHYLKLPVPSLIDVQVFTPNLTRGEYEQIKKKTNFRRLGGFVFHSVDREFAILMDKQRYISDRYVIWDYNIRERLYNQVYCLHFLGYNICQAIGFMFQSLIVARNVNPCLNQLPRASVRGRKKGTRGRTIRVESAY